MGRASGVFSTEMFVVLYYKEEMHLVVCVVKFFSFIENTVAKKAAALMCFTFAGNNFALHFSACV